MIGVGVLNLFPRNALPQKGDRIILELWLGLIIFVLSLMMLSIILPVSLGLSVSTLAVLGGACLMFRPSRCELKLLLSSSGKTLGLTVLALEIGVAALINRPIVWFDTGSYHLGIMRWLNQFGVVPGVALINGNFGFTSAWFPFSAPFTAELFGHKIGAVTNGFVFLLATLTIVLLGRQGCRQSAQLSDYFGVCFFGVTAIAYSVTVFTGAPILISFSPDVAITFLIGVITWLMLLIQQPPSSPPGDLSTQTSHYFDLRALVPPFAAAAFSIKLSAIPIAAMALLFYANHHGQFIIRRFCMGLSIALIMIVPMLTFGTLTAGCPLYPTRLFCLDLPWTLSAASSYNAIKPIAVLKGEKRLPNLLDIQDWIWLLGKRVELFLISPEAQGMVALAIGSLLVCGFVLIQIKRQPRHGQSWILGVGVVGSLFILSTSPLIRFGLGYFSLIPALMVAMILTRFKSTGVVVVSNLLERVASNRTAVLCWLFLGAWCGSLIIHAGTQAQLFRPPTLPLANVTSAEINDVAYRYPDNNQFRCWNTPIPCAPLPLEENIAFRDPDIGLSGGFQRLNTKAADQ